MIKNIESHESQFNSLFVGSYKKDLRNKVLRNVKGKLILDVGCGEGMYMKEIKDREVHGVDFDKCVLKKAKRFGKVKFADIHKIPFNSNKFDTVYCSEVLEHVNNPKRVVEEALRVCKKGGVVIFAVPNDTLHMLSRLFLFKFPLRYPGHINNIHLDDLVKYTGKQPKKVDYVFSRFFPLALIAVFVK